MKHFCQKCLVKNRILSGEKKPPEQKYSVTFVTKVRTTIIIFFEHQNQFQSIIIILMQTFQKIQYF